MSAERFDDLARALAHGASRRQVLKGFAAGLGATVLTTLGRNVPAGTPAVAYAQGEPGKGFLPIVRVDGIDMCPVASTCDEKLQCNDMGADCRCLKSAEGEILCGAVPSCGARECTTSADCADLGPGYFCDSPGSGCCDDMQRCIAPCSAPLTECPAERLCGNACCPEGYNCENGKCVSPFAGVTTEGTWTGTMTYEGQSIGIRFVITEERSEISGRMLMQDPVTQEWLETGAVYGQRTDLYAYWNTESGSVASGDLDKDSFAGVFLFQDYNDEFGIMADLVMQRNG